MCGLALQLETCGGPVLGPYPTFFFLTSRSPTRFSQWRSEKNPLLLPAGGRGKVTILHYAWGSIHFEVFLCSPSFPLPRTPPKKNKKGNHWSLTYLLVGEYPILAPSTMLISLSKWSKGTEKHLRRSRPRAQAHSKTCLQGWKGFSSPHSPTPCQQGSCGIVKDCNWKSCKA